MHQSDHFLAQFWRDLARRRVVRVAAAYAVVAWVLVEVSSVVLPALLVPDWTLRLVIVLALAGFPLALLLVWLFDLTGGRIVRTAPAAGEVSRLATWSARGLFGAVFAAAVAALVLLWPVGVQRTVGPPVNSIAVLPFDNYGEDPDDSYFSDGFAEELLNSLVGIEGLRVAARTSSFAFRDREVDVREIGQQLNVSKVLEGSVRRQGDRVRITAQLVDAEDGYHLWSRTFESRMTDIFAVQDEISRAIVEQLKLTLIAEAPRQVATANVQAYDLYLLGRHHWHQRTRESLERSLELFQQAVELDEDFALAYTGIADAYLLLENYGYLSADGAVRGAEPAIARALELDGSLPEAYASLGLMRLNRGETTAAELALRKAVQLNPNFSMAHMWLALVLRKTGTLFEAERELVRARELDPLHPVVNYNLASTQAAMGDYAGAQQLLLDFTDRTSDPVKSQLALAEIAVMFGRYDEAIAAARRVIERDAGNPDATAVLARAYASLGAFEQAERWGRRLAERAADQPYNLTVLPYIDYLRGDFAGAVAHAQLAADQTTEAKGEMMRRLWSGLVRIREGDHAGGAAELELALEQLRNHEAEPAELLLLQPILAQSYRHLGEEAKAVALLEEALRTAERARTAGWATPQLTAAVAGVQAGLGRYDEAARTLQQAVAEGWRDYWFAVQLPVLEPGHSAQLEAVLSNIRDEVERMRAKVLEADAERSA